MLSIAMGMTPEGLPVWFPQSGGFVRRRAYMVVDVDNEHGTITDILFFYLSKCWVHIYRISELGGYTNQLVSHLLAEEVIKTN